ncbi:MAG: tetratricopeptide repeat protein [Flavobacteriaceae bacterium]|nr:tetratricopeptide repeat protein [Flavobacteriaceae bacterium]
MATYKKKGNKVKNKAGESISAIERDSTTAEVFNTLDETASRSEKWVIKNQKNIFIILGVIVTAILALMAYNNFVGGPKEITAANELAFPKKYFEQAEISAVATDSLYTLGLEGADGKYGFIDIASEFSGTKAGNLANYYAGISYLKMKKYPEAIEFLEKFSSDDEALGPVAKGAIGDAFADLNQPEDALEYYEKAAAERDNSFTTPLFLFKAGNTALDLGKSDRALAIFETIKKNFPKSEEARDIDIYINKAKYAGK